MKKELTVGTCIPDSSIAAVGCALAAFDAEFPLLNSFVSFERAEEIRGAITAVLPRLTHLQPGARALLCAMIDSISAAKQTNDHYKLKLTRYLIRCDVLTAILVCAVLRRALAENDLIPTVNRKNILSTIHGIYKTIHPISPLVATLMWKVTV